MPAPAHDLKEAIQSCERAVALTPKNSPSLLTRLKNLGDVLREHFSAYGETPKQVLL